MSDRPNRREAIVQAALKLFIEQGYNATSVRQISEVVGVTEAALYYHFKDGKRAVLQAVVEHELPDMLSLLEDVKAAESLYDLGMRFGGGLEHLLQHAHKRRLLRWIVAEFPLLSSDERAIVQQKQHLFHATLRELVGRYIPDAVTASHVTWTLMCAGFGYGQLFVNLGLVDTVDFSPQAIGEVLATMLSRAYESRE